MALYESVFIARQDISSSQVDALTDQFSTLITENGGTVTKKEYWGLKNLAFRIRKNRKAHYVLFNLDAPPAAVAEYERNLKINEDVIRFLTVRVDELEEGPSSAMQNRGNREERGGRRGFGDGGRERGGFGDRGGFGEGRDRGGFGDGRERAERAPAPVVSEEVRS